MNTSPLNNNTNTNDHAAGLGAVKSPEHSQAGIISSVRKFCSHLLMKTLFGKREEKEKEKGKKKKRKRKTKAD